MHSSLINLEEKLDMSKAKTLRAVCCLSPHGGQEGTSVADVGAGRQEVSGKNG